MSAESDLADDLDRQASLTSSRTKKIPIQGTRNVLVTSALPYVNNVPHLGNLIGAVLSADVYARYLRQCGVNVLYICGTDEYGTATETKAREEGVSPKALCDKYHELHRHIYQWFDIRFDHFGRTSIPQQTAICQEIFWDVYRNGFVVEDTVEQLYDAEAGMFLADRYVRGTCPHCGYAEAQGDQCDACGNLLNPTELLDPRSALTGSVPVRRTSRHLFLDLPRLRDELEAWIERSAARGQWSENALTMTRSWLRDGLKKRCITRDLRWGVPVPLDGFQDKVFYVWFDAPIGYLSITSDYMGDNESWRCWWQQPDDVELIQFMGKDNTPFHTIIFPGTLLATRRPFTMLCRLSTTEYLNYESGKFSKSRGTGVFGDSASETGIPAYVWRYYLVANRPEQADSVFTWTDLAAKNNNELLANIGNVVSRVVAFVQNQMGGVLPALADAWSPAPLDERLFEQVTAELQVFHQAMANIGLKAALRSSMSIGRLANQYLQETKPWDLFKQDSKRADGVRVLVIASAVIRLLAVTLEPFLGSGFARLVFQQIGVPHADETNRIPQRFDRSQLQEWNYGTESFAFGKPQHLFTKLEPSFIEELRRHFAGHVSANEGSASSGVASSDSELPLELRLGRIMQCNKTAQSDQLYQLVLDLGPEEGSRQAAANLGHAFPMTSDLLGRFVVVCCNVERAVLGGVQSEAMVLVAEKKARTALLTVRHANEAMLGARLLPWSASESGNPHTALMNAAPLSPLDRKGLQSRLKELRVRDDGVVIWKQNKPLAAVVRDPDDPRPLGTSSDPAMKPSTAWVVVSAEASLDVGFWNNARVR
ncbi:methionine--tRNA ligase, cytoplasmic [Cyanidioschyzon merolae strain 10D]|uniref:methionine--tRNA ligase n=1 Tax=Cyanidioschyzon merolae (strain NIES-3377 / 10D) TaxID=280699 RepID=M1VC13_CYAM1|nr:methionine--tRNA ligase, cytoplasmic [Cyanidioschyzon merolae strain 10D]BAM79987.1 methionine--tRNA ligase, cytoplasmic [Cyanidioschyzon merolae strain 10D]|eukprot:XP_005536273.1 methionine--tRNA ligase, cytoplasmic [Cyanidioschyzon merolae strain 10D]